MDAFYVVDDDACWFVRGFNGGADYWFECGIRENPEKDAVWLARDDAVSASGGGGCCAGCVTVNDVPLA